jgi:hypothetical protein
MMQAAAIKRATATAKTTGVMAKIEIMAASKMVMIIHGLTPGASRNLRPSTGKL